MSLCVPPSVSSDILIEYKWHSSRHISQLFIENLYFVANNLSLLYNIHLKIIVLLHCFTLFFLKKYYIPLIELFAIFFACYFHTCICGCKRISKGGHYVNCPCNFIFHVIGHWNLTLPHFHICIQLIIWFPPKTCLFHWETINYIMFSFSHEILQL